METGSQRLKLEHWLHARREAWRAAFVRGSVTGFLFEFVSFGVKQAWACLFGGLMLALLLGTFLLYPADASLPRYDFLTLAALAIQAAMLATKLETWEEARVILIFHVVGTIMEIFKTQVGSWIYPEESFLRIAGVPLFSGFMYAAVGSYIARVWRIMEFRWVRFPPLWLQAILAVAIYANFFTHHWLPDMRLGLFLASAAIYGPCLLYYRPDRAERPMPLLAGLVLVATFIWFAENLGTFARAWTYPSQDGGWHPVSIEKLGSWYLLMIISFVLVPGAQGAANGAGDGNMSGEMEAAGAAVTAGLAAAAIDGGKHAGPDAHGACVNCGAALDGKFCATCGQPAHLHRTLGHMIEEFLHGIIHFDTRAWRTLPRLAFRPGTLTRDYIHGKRAGFISPLAIFLLTVFTMFFVFAFTGDMVVNANAEEASAEIGEARANVEQLRVEAAAADAALAAARAELAAIPDTVPADDPLREAATDKVADAEELAEDKARDIRIVERTIATLERVIADAPVTVGEDGVTQTTKITGLDVFYDQVAEAARAGEINVNTGFKSVDKKILEKLQNPELAVYKIQNTAYKFSFLLVPISLPFMWLLFVWRRGVTLFDHAVVVLYSLSFMSLLFVVAALVAMWTPGILGSVMSIISVAIPVHMYFHIKGAYSLNWFSALWRTFFLLLFCVLALSLFLLAIIVLGLAG